MSVPLIPIDAYTISIPGAVIVIMLAYAIYLWEVGDRIRAKYQFMNVINVFIMILVVGFLFMMTNYIISRIFGIASTVQESWNMLNKASEIFDQIYRKCIDWILYIAKSRAVVALIPYVSPLSDVLGDATMWETWCFSFASTIFLTLKWFAIILTFVQPWLLTFGVALTISDKLRVIGGGLLAILLVMGPAITGLSQYMYTNIMHDNNFIDVPAATQLAADPLNIAARADPAANLAIQASIFSIVIVGISSLLTAGISSVLGSVIVMIRPI